MRKKGALLPTDTVFKNTLLMSGKSRSWTAELIPSQAGRRVLITGANSGIGLETALELARKGAEVILPARSLQKAQDAADRISKKVPGAQVVASVLDLASQESVREFTSWFSEHYPGASIDLLINNAGVMAIPKRELTVDGFERQFATNFLGPFALTARLYTHMRQTAGSRLVVVSSSATKWAKIDFSNLQSERKYSPMSQAYAQSKLADSIFALELNRRLSNAGSPIVAVSAHPGYAITNLQTSGPGKGFSPFRLLGMALKPLLSQDAAHGALPTLFAATSSDANPGAYYGPDGLFELRGFPKEVSIPPAAWNVGDGSRLWETAEHLTGVAFRI
jgi:NAD(P)-dependent dehydrogenase (short-subunit alcohol dehydrogenase family)